MKPRLLVLATAAGILTAVGGAAPTIVMAKSCSAGWKHAKMPSGHKCLRAGQFCASRYDGTYHRYGYHCHTGRLKAK